MDTVKEWLKDYRIQIALVLILAIVVLYFGYFRREKASTKKKPVKKSTKRKPIKRAAVKKNDEQNGHDGDDEDDSDEEIDTNLRADAEEVYNLTHEGLVKGMQANEFKRLVGDLATDMQFIELKQLYNDHRQRGLDPMRSISVVDYIKILKSE
jgi:hypothetical protein